MTAQKCRLHGQWAAEDARRAAANSDGSASPNGAFGPRSCLPSRAKRFPSVDIVMILGGSEDSDEVATGAELVRTSPDAGVSVPSAQLLLVVPLKGNWHHCDKGRVHSPVTQCRSTKRAYLAPEPPDQNPMGASFSGEHRLSQTAKWQSRRVDSARIGPGVFRASRSQSFASSRDLAGHADRPHA